MAGRPTVSVSRVVVASNFFEMFRHSADKTSACAAHPRCPGRSTEPVSGASSNSYWGRGHERLGLVVVSEDWFARSLMRSAAEESARFCPIIDADDGYTALAETWESVAVGRPLSVILIDGSNAGPSVSRLIAEVRSATETQRIFIAIVGQGDGEGPAVHPGANFQCADGVLSPQLSEIVETIAEQAMHESKVA
jgi:hypothetical protein